MINTARLFALNTADRLLNELVTAAADRDDALDVLTEHTVADHNPETLAALLAALAREIVDALDLLADQAGTTLDQQVNQWLNPAPADDEVTP